MVCTVSGRFYSVSSFFLHFLLHPAQPQPHPPFLAFDTVFFTASITITAITAIRITSAVFITSPLLYHKMDNERCRPRNNTLPQDYTHSPFFAEFTPDSRYCSDTRCIQK